MNQDLPQAPEHPASLCTSVGLGTPATTWWLILQQTISPSSLNNYILLSFQGTVTFTSKDIKKVRDRFFFFQIMINFIKRFFFKYLSLLTELDNWLALFIHFSYNFGPE